MPAVIGVRRDGHWVQLYFSNMEGERQATWIQSFSDRDARNLKTPEIVIVIGATALEALLVMLRGWGPADLVFAT